MELTQEILKELLYYEPETGIFIWKFRDRKWFKTYRAFNSWNTKFCGKEAGHIRYANSNLIYRSVQILYVEYQAHRLAFLYIYGSFPINEVDHINGDGLNNKWSNLRDVTKYVNQKNRKRGINNSTGIVGVHYVKKSNKFSARISINNTRIQLGEFSSLEEAAKARSMAEIKHGFSPRHGR